jgi:hypothetical protein
MYPYFSVGMGIMSNHSLFTFYLPRCDPRRFKFLKSESTKTNAIVLDKILLSFPPYVFYDFFFILGL